MTWSICKVLNVFNVVVLAGLHCNLRIIFSTEGLVHYFRIDDLIAQAIGRLFVELLDHLAQYDLEQLRITCAAQAGRLLLSLCTVQKGARIGREVQVVVNLLSISLSQLLNARANFVGVKRHIAGCHEFLRCLLLLD